MAAISMGDAGPPLGHPPPHELAPTPVHVPPGVVGATNNPATGVLDEVFSGGVVVVRVVVSDDATR